MDGMIIPLIWCFSLSLALSRALPLSLSSSSSLSQAVCVCVCARARLRVFQMMRVSVDPMCMTRIVKAERDGVGGEGECKIANLASLGQEASIFYSFCKLLQKQLFFQNIVDLTLSSALRSFRRFLQRDTEGSPPRQASQSRHCLCTLQVVQGQVQRLSAVQAMQGYLQRVCWQYCQWFDE